MKIIREINGGGKGGDGKKRNMSASSVPTSG